MAFTKAPTNSTYQTTEFPIVPPMDNRSFDIGTVDTQYLNVVIKTVKNHIEGGQEFEINKRDGYAKLYTATGGGGLATSITQIFYTNAGGGPSSDGVLYAALTGATGTSAVISIDVSNATPSTFGTVLGTPVSWATQSPDVKFAEFKYDNGTTTVMVTNGSELFEITSPTTSTKVTDAQLPAHVVQSLECMDGYVFLGTVTGDIWNSDLNNPQSWTTGNFIATEMSNDGIWAINKLQNYLVVFGASSCEFFYNAGTATGSPLQRNDSLYKSIGLFNNRVVKYGDILYFIGILAPFTTDVGVYAMTIDSYKKISTPIIDQTLSPRIIATSSTHTSRKQWKQRVGLAVTYLPSLGTPILSVCTPPTTMPTTGAHFWINLTNGSVTTCSLAAIGTGLSFTNSTGFYSIFVISQRYHQTPPTSAIISDSVFYWDSTLTQDDGTNFTFTIQTDLEDFDTINRKSMNRLTLIGEKPASTASVSVSWTDDDYQTFNTPISVDMYQELPSITRLGNFRRRAFKISGTHALPFSLRRMEVDINKGQS